MERWRSDVAPHLWECWGALERAIAAEKELDAQVLADGAGLPPRAMALMLQSREALYYRVVALLEQYAPEAMPEVIKGKLW